MPRIILDTWINAPEERCFDLARSIDLHKISTEQTNEKAISGVTSGLIGLNETVTWEARHLGYKQKLTSVITQFRRPDYFTDEMVKGIFRKLHHRHEFTRIEGKTRMRDNFTYEAPLGFLGKLADALFLKRYMLRLLLERNRIIKEYAESEKWRQIPGLGG